jgi:hypothetical protein
MLELEATGPGQASGRCFIKQDHQGAERGAAHEGVIAAALSEAMALACGPDARARRVELELGGSAPVGAFVEITATSDGQTARASAFADGALIARAAGNYSR